MNARLSLLSTPRPWTPEAIGHKLTSWMDASSAAFLATDAGKAVTCFDRSGRSRHAVQAEAALQPAYANKRLVFTANGVLDKPEGILAAKNAVQFIVFRKQGTMVNSREYPTWYGASGNNTRFVTTGFTGGVRVWRVGVVESIATKAIDAVAHISALRHGPDGTVTAFDDGATLATASRELDGAFSISRLGGLSPASYFRGEVFEEITFTALTDTEIDLVTGYLAHKWDLIAALGLVSRLPTDHPYKDQAPQS